MKREEYREKLVGLVKEKLKCPHVTALTDELRLNEDLRIDSIMLVQLIVYLETELKLQVPDDEVDPRSFSSVGSLLDFMEGLEPLVEIHTAEEGLAR